MKCKEQCEKTNTPCENMSCRHWMNYDEDLNCVLACVDKNGELSLREVAKRLGVSYVRIKQIEDKALSKLHGLKE